MSQPNLNWPCLKQKAGLEDLQKHLPISNYSITKFNQLTYGIFQNVKLYYYYKFFMVEFFYVFVLTVILNKSPLKLISVQNNIH